MYRRELRTLRTLFWQDEADKFITPASLLYGKHALSMDVIRRRYFGDSQEQSFHLLYET